jgi:hypothetical protein
VSVNFFSFFICLLGMTPCSLVGSYQCVRETYCPIIQDWNEFGGTLFWWMLWWQFKYSRTILTNRNSIQVEIKSRLKSGNTFYHSVLSFCLPVFLSRSVKIKICRTIILPVVLYGCKTLCSHWGRNVGWGFSRIRCWGGYLGPRGMR